MLFQVHGNTEPEADVPVAWRAPDAERRPPALKTAAPTAAAQNTVATGIRSSRILVFRICVRIRMVVRTPLRNIPVHVVQAPGVGLLPACRVSLAVAVRAVPGVIAQIRIIVAVAKPGLAPGTADVVPLGLGWQAHRLASLLR